ncbi:MAG: hypothetical protein R3C02_07675 [Planctomycetaceae bacterium]
MIIAGGIWIFSFNGVNPLIGQSSFHCSANEFHLQPIRTARQNLTAVFGWVPDFIGSDGWLHQMGLPTGSMPYDRPGVVLPGDLAY